MPAEKKWYTHEDFEWIPEGKRTTLAESSYTWPSLDRPNSWCFRFTFEPIPPAVVPREVALKAIKEARQAGWRGGLFAHEAEYEFSANQAESILSAAEASTRKEETG